MIKVSVPGKIHLLGEHSVVYGKPAILSSINLKTHVSISESSENKITLNNIVNPPQLITLIKTLKSEIEKKFTSACFPTLEFQIKSEFPIGSGLGSSASCSTALTIALLDYLKIKHTKELVYEIALQGEKVFHGNPSGADVIAVLYGGVTYFKKNLTSNSNFKTLPYPKKINKFILINSGKPIETTAEMVEKVRTLRQSSSVKIDQVFNAQEKLTDELVQVLENDDIDKFIGLINEGQNNLEALGVVSKKAKVIIEQIKDIGGAAKITGAGGIKDGSGMILSFHKNLKELEKLAVKNKWEISIISLKNNE